MARLSNYCTCDGCINTIASSNPAYYLDLQSPQASGSFFPTPRNEEKLGKEKKMAGSYKLVVKNGSWDYRWDAKKNSYSEDRKDAVTEYDTLAEALAEFLYSVQDEDGKKITLSFIPKKKK